MPDLLVRLKPEELEVGMEVDILPYQKTGVACHVPVDRPELDPLKDYSKPKFGSKFLYFHIF
jgi:hypothetical protein